MEIKINNAENLLEFYKKIYKQSRGTKAAEAQSEKDKKLLSETKLDLEAKPTKELLWIIKYQARSLVSDVRDNIEFLVARDILLKRGNRKQVKSILNHVKKEISKL